MPYAARILADSVSPQGVRLTTMEVTYPLIVHNEFMTHRQFSRNAASSRAIPVSRVIEAVQNDPFIPAKWPANGRGMQPGRYWEADSAKGKAAREKWLGASVHAVASAVSLMEQGVHKQIANRLLAPWQWITVVVSATEWSNFFALRCHPDAQAEIRTIAEMMKDLYDTSKPAKIENGAWHLPYLTAEDILSLRDVEHRKVSVARCARVSYRLYPTGDEEPPASDLQSDIALHDRLAAAGHWSPFEHVATPLVTQVKGVKSGNFTGWYQYRKEFAGECR